MYEQDGWSRKTTSNSFWYHWAKWSGLEVTPYFLLTFLVRGKGFSAWSPTPCDVLATDCGSPWLNRSQRRELWHYLALGSLLSRKRATRSMGWIRERIPRCRVRDFHLYSVGRTLIDCFDDWRPGGRASVQYKQSFGWLQSRFLEHAE